MKPLEKSQLSAWRTYLDYEVKQGEDARIRVLFERCLIACAFYEEFWMRVCVCVGWFCVCVCVLMLILYSVWVFLWMEAFLGC